MTVIGHPMLRLFASLLCALMLASPTFAEGVLDGRIFKGMIGPTENPDLDDSLHFADGHFWSDICTRCGFMPGVYTATETPEGIRFTGTLESDSRGEFTYDGLISADGTIDVSIKWQRKRWYRTISREIAFVGALEDGQDAIELASIRNWIDTNDPTANPMCARFGSS